MKIKSSKSKKEHKKINPVNMLFKKAEPSEWSLLIW